MLLAAGGVIAASGTLDITTDRDTWRRLQAGDQAVPAGTDLTATAAAVAPAYRTYDGRGNNPLHPLWGSAGSNYRREDSGAAYADGFSAPAGPTRPSPRVISNAIVDQGDLDTEDERDLATTTYEFGQFLDHDIGLAKGGSTEDLDIHVPAGDPYFDPAGTGTKLIFFDRSAYDPATGTRTPRQQINTVTSFIDASHIYGSDATRAAWLRTRIGGLLKVRPTAVGTLLPLNDGTQANDNPVGAPVTSLGVAGDVRANEQPGLTTLHIAFLREHNRQARRLANLHPFWDDERLYQEARRIVGAEMQVITYKEFLPSLLGRNLPAYTGYKSSVSAGLSNVFAAASYRFGHSQVGPDIDIIDADFEETGILELQDAFFSPTAIPSMGGIDPVIRYMSIDTAQHVDNTIVGPLRNFLFGPPGSGGFDLASLNIQRGRDHGLQNYNRVRADFGQRPVRSFGQITSSSALAAKLQQLYGSVDNIDPWVGLLAEDHVRGGSLGPTSTAILIDQFTRLRDGDRFWYQNGQFSPSDLAVIERTKLRDILQRNSGADGLQPNVFVVCIADFNHSGAVDDLDRLDYLAAYDAGDERADLDENGVVDGDDLAEFLAASSDGC
ncbi:MAG TPA: peroxidase family protein [Candidatus Polarisedimenticolaceae bacterium]|nr:peroxidase family protein [Candidatus Polarisedimenticolaceae bacterium]